MENEIEAFKKEIMFGHKINVFVKIDNNETHLINGELLFAQLFEKIRVI